MPKHIAVCELRNGDKIRRDGTVWRIDRINKDAEGGIDVHMTSFLKRTDSIVMKARWFSAVELFGDGFADSRAY